MAEHVLGRPHSRRRRLFDLGCAACSSTASFLFVLAALGLESAPKEGGCGKRKEDGRETQRELDPHGLKLRLQTFAHQPLEFG